MEHSLHRQTEVLVPRSKTIQESKDIKRKQTSRGISFSLNIHCRNLGKFYAACPLKPEDFQDGDSYCLRLSFVSEPWQTKSRGIRRLGCQSVEVNRTEEVYRKDCYVLQLSTLWRGCAGQTLDLSVWGDTDHCGMLNWSYFDIHFSFCHNVFPATLHKVQICEVYYFSNCSRFSNLSSRYLPVLASIQVPHLVWVMFYAWDVVTDLNLFWTSPQCPLQPECSLPWSSSCINLILDRILLRGIR